MGAGTQSEGLRASLIAERPTEDSPLEEARRACTGALQARSLRQVASALRGSGYSPRHIVRIVAAVSDAPATLGPIKSLQASLAIAKATEDSPSFERFLLLTTALESLDRLPALPVASRVKELFCDEFVFYASPRAEHLHRFAIGTSSFAAMCKTSSLRRFPAGQFDWEVGGIRRSDLLKVSPRRLLPTMAFAAFRMRGLHPVFFSHLNWRRPNQALLEIEGNRSYYRMAQAMKLQPRIRGFGACSWFRSPGTHRVSPHLGWLSRVIVENGGLVVEAGADSPQSGVLYRSQTRRRLYDEGKFRPTKGLVMWPRDAMIAWAAAHPEFGD